jgi:hypothetical protein
VTNHLLFAVLLALPLTIRAEAGDLPHEQPVRASVQVDSAYQAGESADQFTKNLRVAYALAFGGLALGGVTEGPLSAAALIIGPSLGQYFAGAPVAGTAGVVVRGAGLWIVAAGMGLEFLSDPAGRDDEDDNDLITAGTLIFLGGTAYSLIDTYFAVKQNEEPENEAGVTTRILLAPYFSRDGRVLPGLAARITF